MTGRETENRRKVAIVGILNGLSVGAANNLPYSHFNNTFLSLYKHTAHIPLI